MFFFQNFFTFKASSAPKLNHPRLQYLRVNKNFSVKSLGLKQTISQATKLMLFRALFCDEDLHKVAKAPFRLIQY